ncbi:MAG: UDP-N-acetylmuramoyl-L-alanine--D-glutamate ligase [Coxiellaceae bacterium]|nr:UDP-N-acetylmuramoyl-L-alanine--D-glutamate ligase [Coxiellaceae bacterium]
MKHNLKIIVGLGKTGISCVRYLTKQKCNFAVVDSRSHPPALEELQKKSPSVPTYLGKIDENILSQAQELIISPGVPLSEPAIAACLKRGIEVIGDIELFARTANVPIIAITGSNGKSTVTSLVGEMIKAAGKRVGIGGNLGVPALDLLNQNVDFYVLELSSFQLETTVSLKAKAAVVLNISPDHMDRYQSFNDYLQIKQRIYTNCQVAIINRDDHLSHAHTNLSQPVISFGSSKPLADDFGIDHGYLMYGNEKIIPISKLKIKGLHNAINAVAALALGKAIDLPLQQILSVLYEFPGLPHRCQWVANINGVDWYNDSKGTNVGATTAAIEGLGKEISGKIILIAGGLGKDADFSPLQDVIIKYVKTVVLIGKDAPLIQKTLMGTSKILLAPSMQEAVIICAKEASSKDVVLLSPACASYDMFNNFEHRGELFIEEVKKL